MSLVTYIYALVDPKEHTLINWKREMWICH
jgi:hypothetical protein